jgi:hypothetical protein
MDRAHNWRLPALAPSGAPGGSQVAHKETETQQAPKTLQVNPLLAVPDGEDPPSGLMIFVTTNRDTQIVPPLMPNVVRPLLFCRFRLPPMKTKTTRNQDPLLVSDAERMVQFTTFSSRQASPINTSAGQHLVCSR